MKAPFLILLLILAAGAGALGGTLTAPTSPAALDASADEIEPLEPVAADLRATDDVDELARRADTERQMEIAVLAERIAELEQELTSLRSGLERTPVTAAKDALTPAKASNVPETSRRMVLAVLEEERLREEREREQRRIEKDQERIAQRASKVVKKLSLAPEDETFLVDYYAREEARREETRQLVRDMGRDRDTTRGMLEEMKTWQQQELSRQFDADTVTKILKTSAQGNDRRGGRRGN